MPSEQENIQYLYLVLTHGGVPTINWDAICADLQLEKGAVTKRWSRLKQAMDKGVEPARSNHEFLWLMVKHSARDKAFDWDGIADKCNSTKAACSKRYSRLKIAFDKGDAPPPTPTKASKSAPTTPKQTPRKSKLKTEDDSEDTPTTPVSKRKRTPAKKPTASLADKFKPETDEDEEEERAKPKRAKSTPEVKRKPKNAFRASDNKGIEETQPVVKGEPVDDSNNDDDDHVFFDAREQASAFTDTDAEVDRDTVCKKIGLSETYREELEGMLGVLEEA
ncbi:hypothetical protein ST47_g2942 [Ascochyta rabiei]|uniref:Myb-like DNA-binding domain-containing protein n=1 Tax=Didymella rabiei TaxID=5454 RepID=A0A163IQ81_DIDRA|nr:hypothetical protein ST47_g2942 [Ascochyta rabiei]